MFEVCKKLEHEFKFAGGLDAAIASGLFVWNQRAFEELPARRQGTGSSTARNCLFEGRDWRPRWTDKYEALFDIK